MRASHRRGREANPSGLTRVYNLLDMFLTLGVLVGACAGLVLNLLFGLTWYMHRRRKLAKQKQFLHFTSTRQSINRSAHSLATPLSSSSVSTSDLVASGGGVLSPAKVREGVEQHHVRYPGYLQAAQELGPTPPYTTRTPPRIRNKSNPRSRLGMMSVRESAGIGMGQASLEKAH